MNHFYRLVWNECTGAWVPVSETTCTRKKGIGRTTRMALIASLLASGLCIPQAFAEQQAATTVVPTGGSTNAYISANGVPVVDINNPNAAGLSHNTYSRFDVEQNGLVLNNGNISQIERQSQLAGRISANLNLQNEATVILNEVVSTNQSTLAGFTEVVGGQADVIVANPNGITCNGCGFLNTNRATLTTGTANLGNDGSLSGFSVNRGEISIEGNGANASDQQIFDLVARNVIVVGNINVNGELGIITGNNTWDYASREITDTAAASGTAPSYAVDSTALGGMYAGRIRIIATEAGVGVRMLGNAAASADDFTLSSAGKIEIVSIELAENDFTGVSAERDVNISGGDLDNQGSIRAKNKTTIDVDNLVNGSATNSTAFIIAALDDGDATTTTDSMITVNGDLINYGAIHSDDNLSIKAATILNTDTGGLSSNAALDLEATGGEFFSFQSDIENHGALYARESMSLTAPVINTPFDFNIYSITNTSSGTINSDGTISIKSDYFTNYNQIVAGGEISISASYFTNETTIDGVALSKSKSTCTYTFADYPDCNNTDFHPLTLSVEYSPGGLGQSYGMNAGLREYTFSKTEVLDDGVTIQQINAAKAQIISNSRITIKDYVRADNTVALISAPNVTITGKSNSSSFTNKSLDLITWDYRRAYIDIRDSLAGVSTDYRTWVRVKPGTGYTPVAKDSNDTIEKYNPNTGVSTDWVILSNNQTLTAAELKSLWVLTEQGATPSNPTIRTGNSIGAGIFSNGGKLNLSGGNFFNVGSPYEELEGKASILADNTGRPVGAPVFTINDLPTNPNGYYVPTTSDSNARYLIETNPLFNVGSDFVGSDYMLDHYGYNPDDSLRRLGDANYEAYLIRQQLISQTGNNILAGYGTESDQMKVLMDQAYEESQVAEESGKGFTFGDALTPAQIASLGKDIVWMVETEVQGEKVLSPVVYLAPSTSNAIKTGAVIGGDNINMNLASFSNTGGSISATDSLTITAEGDITNTSGNISGGDVALTSTQGSIINQTQVQGAGDDISYSSDIGKTGTIESTGTMNLDANKDIKIIGAEVTAGGDADITAGGSITVDTIVDKTITTTGTGTLSQLSSSLTTSTTETETNIGSGIKIGGNATMTAGDQITVRGADVNIDGNAVVDGKNGVNILDAVDKKRTTTVTTRYEAFGSDSGSKSDSDSGSESDSDAGPAYAKAEAKAEATAKKSSTGDFTLSETTTTTTNSGKDTSVSSNFNVGGNLKVKSEGTLKIQGSNVKTGGEMNLDEINNLEVLSGQNKEWSDTTTVKESIGIYGEGTAKADAGTEADAKAGTLGIIPNASASAEASASADGTATFGARTETEITSDFKLTNTASTLKSGGKLTINVKEDAVFVGAEVESGGDMSIDAKNITNLAAQDIDKHTFSKTTKTEGLYVDAKVTAKASADANAGKIAIGGGGTGADAEAGVSADVSAGLRYKTESKNSTSTTITQQTSSFKSGGSLTRNATETIVDQGTQLEAGGDINQTAHEIREIEANNSTVTTSDSTSHDIKAGVGAGAGANAAGGTADGKSSDGKMGAGIRAKYAGKMAEGTTSSTTAVTTRYNSGGNIKSVSEEKTTLIGTEFISAGDVNIEAGSLDYKAAHDTTFATSNSDTIAADLKVDVYGKPGGSLTGSYANKDKGSSSSTARTGSINAGGKLNIKTKNDASFEGTQLAAKDSASIVSENGSVDFKAARDTETSSENEIKVSASLKGSKTAQDAGVSGGYSKDQSSSDTARVAGVTAGAGGITISAGKDAKFEGTDLASTGGVNVTAVGDVTLMAAKNTVTGSGFGVNGGVGKAKNAEGSRQSGSIGGNVNYANTVTSKVTNIDSGAKVVIKGKNVTNQETSIKAADGKQIIGKVTNIEAERSDIALGFEASVSGERETKKPVPSTPPPTTRPRSEAITDAPTRPRSVAVSDAAPTTRQRSDAITDAPTRPRADAITDAPTRPRADAISETSAPSAEPSKPKKFGFGDAQATRLIKLSATARTAKAATPPELPESSEEIEKVEPEPQEQLTVVASVNSTTPVGSANPAPVNVTIRPSTPIDLAVALPELPPNEFFEVKRADGASLPAWVKFDSATGAFSGTPPAGFTENFDAVINVPQLDGSTKTVTVKFVFSNTN
jgi:filamentous hemagglutinin